MDKPYLLFDAGGTLAFPDFDYLSQVALNLGVQVQVNQLYKIHCQMILDLDERTQIMGHLAEPFPNGYPQTLFKDLVHDPVVFQDLMSTVENRNKGKSLWTSTHPWVHVALDKLRSSGFKMSVISNSDGRVNQILEELGLKSFFDGVFDSHVLGVSKPDRRIFEIALEDLDLQPKDAIYIGDVFFIDVWGSNQAGLGCIHLDPEDIYSQWPGIHLPTIAHLPAWLSDFQQNKGDFDLFPALDLTITH